MRVPEAVTPKGVWKRPHLCRGQLQSEVPEAVTPKGVWKQSPTACLEVGTLPVPEAVTPKGVWKRTRGSWCSW